MPLLKKGSSGPAVSALIVDLTKAGFPPTGAPGDVFDREVEKALSRYQAVGIGPDGKPLVQDGQAGPLTLFALDVTLGRRPPVPLHSLPVPPVAAKPPGASTFGWNALQIAKRELAAGAGEIGSNNAGPDVMRYHAVTGASKGDSWCASFVAYCFKEGNPGAMPYPPTAGAQATLAAFKKKGWVVEADIDDPPQPGDIIVWWRGKTKTWLGHIGIVSAYADGIVYTIEGNRGDFPSKVSAFDYKLGKIDKLLGFGRAQP